MRLIDADAVDAIIDAETERTTTFVEHETQANIKFAIKNLPTVEPAADVPDIYVGNKWIPVSERLPENEEEVEISCIRRYIGAGDEKKECYFTARASHVDGTLTTEDSNFVWNDIETWEYNEEKDAYIIPEGWWEYVTFSEEFGAVDAEVVAWRPIAEPYKGE